MIVVCGEALIDVVRNPDGTQLATPGGGPFNTARALARLGVPTAFLGHLSDDTFGRALAGLLVADGASLELATIGSEKTTIAVADLDPDGVAEYQFLVEGTSAPNLTPDMVPAQLASDVAALHIGTLGMVLEPIASTLTDLVRREHERRVVMLDPNVRLGMIPDDEYRARLLEVVGLSTIVKASEEDLSWLYPGASLQTAARQLLDSGVRLVVVTLGPRGAFGAQREFHVTVDSAPVEVVDTIGAGDAFGAALLAWLHDDDALDTDLRLEPAALERALDYACVAAAITCSRPGADPPWKGEMPAVRS
ncbi:MAG TPA: carbohydrate kinase [Candidatus Dormibacteraeota bacterium]|nr:carbohydrate kinase [Candidatus Dormibacteraeota bacterium]